MSGSFAVNVRRTDVIKPTRRYNFLFCANKYCLPNLKRDHRNWKFVLGQILREFNHYHATKAKFASTGTQVNRKKFYFRFFAYVCTKFKIDPRSLRYEHVEDYLMAHIEKRQLHDRSNAQVKKALTEELSMLNYFCRIIGKPGLIKKGADYFLRKAALGVCAAVYKPRADFISKEVFDSVLAEAKAADLRFYMQLIALAAFGLRPQEAVGLIYPESFLEKDGIYYLNILKSNGSKGGKPRLIQANTESMVSAWMHLEYLAKEKSVQSFCWNGMPLSAGYKKFYQLYSKLKTADLPSPYNFRYTYAVNQLNFTADKGKVSEFMGHHRSGVTTTYIGHGAAYGIELVAQYVKAVASAERRHAAIEDAANIVNELWIDGQILLALSLSAYISKAPKEKTENQIAAALQVFYPDSVFLEPEAMLTDLCELGVSQSEAYAFLKNVKSRFSYEKVVEYIVVSSMSRYAQ